MNAKLTVFVALSLIIGIGIGYGINYAIYQPQTFKLQSELNSILSELSADISVEILHFRVLSSSMEPTLKGDDIVFVRRTNVSEIKAAPYPDGDIIVFHKPDDLRTFIAHRAIEKTAAPNGTIYFRTKGDGSPNADSFSGHDTWNGTISENLVVGKVIAIKHPSS